MTDSIRTAIVTGAANGIGSAVVDKLASLGIAVVAVDLDADGAAAVASRVRDSGLPATSLAGDVSDPALSVAAVDAAVGLTGGLDILVNNAGKGTVQAAIADTELENWRRDIEVNLTGQFLFCRAAIPALIARGWGRIVNVASASGMEGLALAGGYAAAKAGVIALTKTLGKELAQTGVIVNAVAPALIRSEMLSRPTFRREMLESLLARIPMGRVGEPSEVAEMIAFLASDAVSFSTGAVFDLSGGRATY
ncbi:SDR family NAD(P)-dependent oxidoreductase [Microbacterium betulae]|uniref:SDR family NAD(P)-dependent oxidoreductase n=1 Tax=Microbacterium betulae TaxID=2981139 RepID=A0AA97I5I4_9MICO|nr:SDR family NAD(P)-dependent oxidoreductase [Microbacterium sp. AB]WOF22844.1 SDR family NAD(P)-dependent oxidoreductase [Microbacterium sp. AB]